MNLLADWPGPHKWEIGLSFSPEFWGCGYATEGAYEGVRFGFQDALLDRVISVTDVRL